MGKPSETRRILVLHGPNMDLLGLRSAKAGTRVTLDKVNRAMRRAVRETPFELKILQTHCEATAVTFLHRNRNRAAGLIFSPESWHPVAFVIADTLRLLELPTVLVGFHTVGESVFGEWQSVISTDPVAGYLQALEKLTAELSGG